LVEWAGKSIIHPNKAAMPTHINTLLINMNLQPDNWLNQVKNLNKGSPHSIGCLESLREKAKSLNKKWIKGIGMSQLLYAKP
jgi:hypothetical protein